nr:hypothetical protein [Candidatus Babeliales bacterium]
QLHIIESGEPGLVLCSSELGSNPVFVQPTAGAGLNIVSNQSILEYALNVPVDVESGGTGLTAIPAHSLLIGQDDHALGMVTPCMTAGVALVSQGPFADPTFGIVSVVGGGTGQTCFPKNGVLLGQQNAAISSTAAGMSGQVLVGATNKPPMFVTPTAGLGLDVQSDAKTLQYSLQVPVNVACGGTGSALMTAYSLIAGGISDTAKLQSLSSCGNPGDVLCSNGAHALPSWKPLIGSECHNVSVENKRIGIRNAVSNCKKINHENTNILTIQNNAVFQNQSNHVVVYPDCLSLSNTSATVAMFTLYLNPTILGAVSFTDIDSNGSVVSCDVAGTAVCSGRRIMIFFVNNSSYLTINLQEYDIILCPGDRLVVACATTNGNANVYAAISWLEKF